MIRVTLVGRGGVVHVVEGKAGTTLLALALGDAQPLEGTCGGAMACATCHVVIDPADHDRLPAASAAEEDMLDFVAGATRTSRLACQIVLAPAIDGLSVCIPD